MASSLSSSSSSSPTRFIEAALSCCTGPYAVSYADADQKWVIRKHMISLIHKFPTLTPSVDPFFHDNGSIVNLLNARGDLRVSQSTPAVPVIIWLHESYPFVPPLVFVTSHDFPVHPNHPFVDSSSGAATSPYLIFWNYPHSNLSDFVRNLVKLFSHDHPFLYFQPPPPPGGSSGGGFCCLADPRVVSKQEAIDRLVGRLHYDIAAVKRETAEEIEGLSSLQAEMERRVEVGRSMVAGLDRERRGLKRRVKEVTEAADVLVNWVVVNDPNNNNNNNNVNVSGAAMAAPEEEQAFEAADGRSEVVMKNLAGDKAMEDLMDALEEAFKQGAITLQAYIKHVRVSARHQFSNRFNILSLTPLYQ